MFSVVSWGFGGVSTVYKVLWVAVCFVVEEVFWVVSSLIFWVVVRAVTVAVTTVSPTGEQV